MRCRAPEIIAGPAMLERLALSRCLVDVALRRLRVAVRGSVLANVGGFATQPHTLVGRRLRSVTLSRSRLTQLRGAVPIQGGMTTVRAALIEL
jgi:hypothetical protein